MLQLPKVGDVLAAKFRLVARLGEGGMGVVFEAEQLRLKRRVAIKMLQPKAVEDPTVVERFQREARAAALLESRHVARILDVDEHEGLPFMVLELLTGDDLEKELERRGRFPVEEAVEHVLQACDAMREAHARGIIHRDLKPSNLFLAKDGEARIIKVLDFGISKLSEEGNMRLTAVDSAMGTPLYMAPEQVRSAVDTDARTDVWALGVILYELLAGQPPFTGATVAALGAAIVMDEPPPLEHVRPDVLPALADVVRHALAKRPGDRVQDMTELASRLAPFAPRARFSMAPFAAAPAGRASSYPDVLRASVPPGRGLVEVRTGPATGVPPPVSARSNGTLPGTATTYRHGLAPSRARILVPAMVLSGLGIAALAWFVATSGERPASSAGSSAPAATPAPVAASAATVPVTSSPAPSSSGVYLELPPEAPPLALSVAAPPLVVPPPAPHRPPAAASARAPAARPSSSSSSAPPPRPTAPENPERL